jgi:hypothetical protein
VTSSPIGWTCFVADSLSHARHDRFTIAAPIGGPTVPASVGTCRRCGALHRDLLAIQSALRHAWTPKRPRDLRLDVIDISRLRPSLWRRVLGAVGSCRDAISRPLAVGLTSVGIVGLVLTSTVSVVGAASGAAATEMSVHASGYPATVPDAPDVPDAAREVRPTEPMLALSTGSLAAGGGVFVLRRLAARARGVR